MAVMATVFNEVQRSTLEALCDTFVPAVETDSGDPVEREFMARSAGDLQVAAQMEAMLADALLPEEAAEIGGLLDALARRAWRPRRRWKPARRSSTACAPRRPRPSSGSRSSRG